MVLLADALELAAQQAVGADAAGDGQLAHVVVDGGALHLLDEEAHDGLLDGGAEVGLVALDEVGVFLQPVAQEVEEGGLDAREGVVVACDVWCGEGVGVGVALLGEAVDDGTSRVAEVHDLGGLVDGFACGVVDGGAEALDVEVVAQQQYLGVAAGDQQADEGELGHGLAAFDEVGEHVGLEVVDLDEGFADGCGEALGEADAHEE